MKRLSLCILGIIMLAGGCVTRMAVKNNSQGPRAPKISYSETSGDSYNEAIKITGAQKQSQGVEAEYSWISSKHGIKDKDWRIVGQVKIQEEGKLYDVIEISLSSDSDRRIYYFDVSDFSWKRE